MSSKYVSRPKASKIKIHSKNEFELCYLRHKYFRKVKFNPTKEQMLPFSHISNRLARNTFFRYQPLFHEVGFEFEDVLNIANVHLVSFLGLFSLEKMPDKYKEFTKTFKKIQEKDPENQDILDKNQANFTLFLKQRMDDVVRICKQKAKNIKGLLYEEHTYYRGPKKPPKNMNSFVKNYEKFGFKKIDYTTFKSARKKVGLINTLIFSFNKNYYVAVPIKKKNLNLNDFCGANLDPYDNIHNMNPENLYLHSEENNNWKSKLEEFNNKNNNIKINIIRNFISKNKNNKNFTSEIKIAKSMLKGIERSNG